MSDETAWHDHDEHPGPGRDGWRPGGGCAVPQKASPACRRHPAPTRRYNRCPGTGRPKG